MQSLEQDNFDLFRIYNDSLETFGNMNTYLPSLMQAIYNVVFCRLIEHLCVLLVDRCRCGRSAAKSCAQRGQHECNKESGKCCRAAHWHIISEIGQNDIATTVLICLSQRLQRGSFVLQRRCCPSQQQLLCQVRTRPMQDDLEWKRCQRSNCRTVSWQLCIP